MRMRVEIGSILDLEVDIIVNAANTNLRWGSGVDGAIHRAAGPELANFCAGLGGCKPGKAVLTPGFRLTPIRIIHTVGPVWRGGLFGEDEVLASCYRESIRLAREAGAKSIAFPAISTGIYGFPVERAAKIAVETVRHEMLKGNVHPEVIFTCIDEANLMAYNRMLSGMEKLPEMPKSLDADKAEVTDLIHDAFRDTTLCEEAEEVNTEKRLGKTFTWRDLLNEKLGLGWGGAFGEFGTLKIRELKYYLAPAMLITLDGEKFFLDRHLDWELEPTLGDDHFSLFTELQLRSIARFIQHRLAHNPQFDDDPMGLYRMFWTYWFRFL